MEVYKFVIAFCLIYLVYCMPEEIGNSFFSAGGMNESCTIGDLDVIRIGPDNYKPNDVSIWVVSNETHIMNRSLVLSVKSLDIKAGDFLLLGPGVLNDTLKSTPPVMITSSSRPKDYFFASKSAYVVFWSSNTEKNDSTGFKIGIEYRDVQIIIPDEKKERTKTDAELKAIPVCFSNISEKVFNATISTNFTRIVTERANNFLLSRDITSKPVEIEMKHVVFTVITQTVIGNVTSYKLYTLVTIIKPSNKDQAMFNSSDLEKIIERNKINEQLNLIVSTPGFIVECSSPMDYLYWQIGLVSLAIVSTCLFMAVWRCQYVAYWNRRVSKKKDKSPSGSDTSTTPVLDHIDPGMYGTANHVPGVLAAYEDERATVRSLYAEVEPPPEQMTTPKGLYKKKSAKAVRFDESSIHGNKPTSGKNRLTDRRPTAFAMTTTEADVHDIPLQPLGSGQGLKGKSNRLKERRPTAAFVGRISSDEEDGQFDEMEKYEEKEPVASSQPGAFQGRRLSSRRPTGFATGLPAASIVTRSSKSRLQERRATGFVYDEPTDEPDNAPQLKRVSVKENKGPMFDEVDPMDSLERGEGSPTSITLEHIGETKM